MQQRVLQIYIEEDLSRRVFSYLGHSSMELRSYCFTGCWRLAHIIYGRSIVGLHIMVPISLNSVMANKSQEQTDRCFQSKSHLRKGHLQPQGQCEGQPRHSRDNTKFSQLRPHISVNLNKRVTFINDQEFICFECIAGGCRVTSFYSWNSLGNYWSC